MQKSDAIFDIFFTTLGYDVYGFDYDTDKWVDIDPFVSFAAEMKAHGFDVYNITDHGDELEINIDGETYTCLKRIDDVTNSQEALALYGMDYSYQGIYWYRYFDFSKQ